MADEGIALGRDDAHHLLQAVHVLIYISPGLADTLENLKSPLAAQARTLARNVENAATILRKAGGERFMSSPVQESTPPSKSLRILIVDDSEDGAIVLQQFLKGDGHDTRAFFSGKRTLENLDFEPDLAFLDIAMPEMDGFELLRELKQDSRTKKTIFIALSAYARDSDKEKALKAGFNLFLAKPAFPEKIRRMIRGLQAAHEAA